MRPISRRNCTWWCFQRQSCLISHPVTPSSMKRVYRASTLPTYIITISVDLFTFTRFIHSGARSGGRLRRKPVAILDPSPTIFFSNGSFRFTESIQQYRKPRGTSFPVRNPSEKAAMNERATGEAIKVRRATLILRNYTALFFFLNSI